MLHPGPKLTASLFFQRHLPWRFAERLDVRIDAALREKYRTWIRKTPPLSVATGQPKAEVHQLLGHRHVGMGLWSLKSLVKAAAADVGVVVHDDGSLTEDDAVLLKEQLPGLRIIRRAEADAAVSDLLAAYPACRSFRFGEVNVTNHRGQSYNMFIMSLILFDINLLTACDKIIILDADVLFFRRPDIIADWALDDNDTRTLYSVEAYKPQRQPDGSLSFGPKAAHTLNSGLLCLTKSKVYDLDRIEAWIAGNPDLMYTSPVFEQLCYAYLVKNRPDSVELDPALYGFNYTTPESIATHFGIKRRFYENLYRAGHLLTAG